MPINKKFGQSQLNSQLSDYQKTDKVRIDFYNSSDRQQHHQTMQTLWDKPIKINCL